MSLCEYVPVSWVLVKARNGFQTFEAVGTHGYELIGLGHGNGAQAFPLEPKEALNY